MRESDETASGRVQPSGDRATAPDHAPAEREKAGHEAHSLVIVASRLPVDRIETSDGEASWRPSPGGLVTALEPVMRSSGGVWIGWAGDAGPAPCPVKDGRPHPRRRGVVPPREPVMRSSGGVWIGWSGDAGPAPGPFKAGGLHLVGLGLSADQIRDYYEGFCNATLWPLYHDVIAPPQFRRPWWDAYVRVNRRYAEVVANQPARGATVWVHDYQLQLVPGMVRALRADVRIGYFNHIPFPGYEIFAQLPWRRQIVRGLLGADLVGFQRHSDATNFLRACRRSAGLATRGSLVRVPDAGFDDTHADHATRGARRQRVAQDNFLSGRDVRAAAFPISIDTRGFEKIAREPDVRARAQEIREALGKPDIVLLGIDRLDYTQGLLHP